MTNYWPEGWLVNTAQNHSFCQNISGLREALHSQTILEARACVCTPEHDRSQRVQRRLEYPEMSGLCRQLSMP